MKIKCPHCGLEIKVNPGKGYPTKRQLLAWAYYCVFQMTQQETANRMGVSQQTIWELLKCLDRKWPGFVMRNAGGANKFSLLEEVDAIRRKNR
jgi:hypothetical protein